MPNRQEKLCANCNKNTDHIDDVCQVCNKTNKGNTTRKYIFIVFIVIIVLGIILYFMMQKNKPQPVEKALSQQSSFDADTNNIVSSGQVSTISADRFKDIKENVSLLRKKKSVKRGNVYYVVEKDGRSVVIMSGDVNAMLDADSRPNIVFNLDKTAKDKLVFNFDFNVHTSVIYKQLKSFDDYKQTLINNKESIDSVFILGHTDDVGSNSYNDSLSLKRCRYLGDALKTAGIKVINIGYGESMPIANNSTDGGKAENRRIEIIVIKK